MTRDYNPRDYPADVARAFRAVEARGDYATVAAVRREIGGGGTTEVYRALRDLLASGALTRSVPRPNPRGPDAAGLEARVEGHAARVAREEAEARARRHAGGAAVKRGGRKGG